TRRRSTRPRWWASASSSTGASIEATKTWAEAVGSGRPPPSPVLLTPPTCARRLRRRGTAARSGEGRADAVEEPLVRRLDRLAPQLRETAQQLLLLVVETG